MDDVQFVSITEFLSYMSYDLAITVREWHTPNMQGIEYTLRITTRSIR